MAGIWKHWQYILKKHKTVAEMFINYYIKDKIEDKKFNYETDWGTYCWQWKCLADNTLSLVYCSVTYPTLSMRVRSSPLSVRASKFRTKMPNALDGSISILSFNSSPKPTTEASWPFRVTIRMRTFGVGAVLVTIFVPDGRNGTLRSYADIRQITSFL